MESPLLCSEPLKQQAWYKQIKDKILDSQRSIDRLSIAQIREMYLERKFLCDICEKQLEKCDISMVDHITHLINPSYKWVCEDCFQNDLRNNRIIGLTEENPPKKWQLDSM